MHEIDRCNSEYIISRATKLSVPKVKVILCKDETQQKVKSFIRISEETKNYVKKSKRNFERKI